MSKTFANPPKPKTLTADSISAFERGGVGQDTQINISIKEENIVPTKVGDQGAKRRLSIDIPEILHRRFKTACSKTDKRMVAEVMNFIKRRTIELENE
jgi:hypothetical protein